MMNWCYYPKYDKIPKHLENILDVFEKNKNDIKSPPERNLHSNEVLKVIREDLEAIDYIVERGKKGKIIIPVLFVKNGKIKKKFEVDAYNENTQTIIEVEGGRGFTNSQYLKALFEACMMPEVKFLVTAIRNKYLRSSDFKKVKSFYNTLYTSNRSKFPLTGVLIIGYGDL